MYMVILLFGFFGLAMGTGWVAQLLLGKSGASTGPRRSGWAWPAWASRGSWAGSWIARSG